MAAVALKAEKKVLRKSIAAILRELSSTQIQDQSREVTARVLAMPSFAQSKSVGCYLSMPGGEIDTSTLVREILRSGKTLFVPKIGTSTEGRMDLLQIYDEADVNALPSGVWGIKEPDRVHNGLLRTNAMDFGLCMILVPGLAFDRSLSRLGHGKGYYDRFITTYSESKRPMPLLVGLALHEQHLESGMVPTGEYDWKMDYVITDEGELVQIWIGLSQ